MGVEALESSYEMENEIESDVVQSIGARLNNTDARRRLEDKIEELRLKKEMQEFDFDY